MMSDAWWDLKHDKHMCGHFLFVILIILLLLFDTNWISYLDLKIRLKITEETLWIPRFNYRSNTVALTWYPQDSHPRQHDENHFHWPRNDSSPVHSSGHSIYYYFHSFRRTLICSKLTVLWWYDFLVGDTFLSHLWHVFIGRNY